MCLRKNTRGFSLVEIMVVLVVMAVALVAMAPHFAKAWRRADLDIAATRLETALRICRQKSVLTRKPYRLTLNPAAGYFYSERRDSVGVWVVDPAETSYVDRGISFASVAGGSSTNLDLLFETRGTVSAADTPARIEFWNARGETLLVHLIRTGRVRMSRKR